MKTRRQTRTLSTEDNLRMETLYHSGENLMDIAKEMELPYYVVQSSLNLKGLTRKKNNRLRWGGRTTMEAFADRLDKQVQDIKALYARLESLLE